jgi:hypothetical protein
MSSTPTPTQLGDSIRRGATLADSAPAYTRAQIGLAVDRLAASVGEAAAEEQSVFHRGMDITTPGQPLSL